MNADRLAYGILVPCCGYFAGHFIWFLIKHHGG